MEKNHIVKNIYKLMLLLVIGIISCVPPTDEVITEVNLDYTNTDLQQIYTYIDRQDVDSLLSYTSHKDPAFRYLVANAFAAIKSDEGIDSLAKLLTDPVIRVRRSAAYALGQIGVDGCIPILLEGFKDKDTMRVNNTINSTILEAVGKSGGQQLLKSLATVTTYRKTDSLLLLGQAKGVYRYALRGITAPEGTDLMVQYVSDRTFPRDVRLMAAHYLQRSKNISIEEYKFRISEAMVSETDVAIKMALAAALGKTNDREILEVMIGELNNEEVDYRVKVNILRSLSLFPYINAVEPVLQYLTNPDVRLASTAANYLIQHGNSSDATIYRSFIQDTMHFLVKSKIYAAVLNHIPYYYSRTKAIIKNEVMSLIEGAEDPYEKAAYLDALSYDPNNYSVMKEVGFNGAPVLKTTAMNGLGRILENNNFTRIFRGGSNRVKLEIIDLIKEGMSSGDAGMIAVAGSILKNADLNLNEIITDVSFIDEAISNLELPKETESLQELEAAKAFFTGVEYRRAEPTYNHPIDWRTLNTISDSTVAAIRTEKGVITVSLNNRLTPGTVANFVNLVNDGFYNQKVFHRVVPNFVIQTGCPRGDGYGSLDYTIRSELPQLYYDDEGYIGMASAGNHTEGTQWFITHSPTPHLDGNYTIFGKVLSGMEVVHQIEQGDQIQDIILTRK